MMGLRLPAKVGLCLIVSLLVVLAFLSYTKSIDPQRLVSTATWSRLLAMNKTKQLEKKHPSAVCHLDEIVLKEEDYSAIETCVKGYVKMETIVINKEQMEGKRVLMHRPWLTREDSLMIEVGGYTGADADRLLAQGMHPRYIMLEPVPHYYKLLINKFKNDKRFVVLNYGLGRESRTLTIPIQTDATSLFRQDLSKLKNGTQTTDISIRKSMDFFNEVGVQNKNVDLLHINCEGCEFELLEDLMSTGYIKYFNHIQFQFHMHLPYIEKEACRYCQIMQLLTRTHKPMFQYKHTWQAWQLK